MPQQPDMPVQEGSRATVDFDHHDIEWLSRRHEHNAELRGLAPVVWNPRFGGFWFVTGYDEVLTVAKDATTFTSEYVPGTSKRPECIGIAGVPRPQVPSIGVAESEGERHRVLRRLINRFMLPPAVEGYRPYIRQAAAWFLDEKVEDGRMDLVRDFTSPVPAVLTLQMTGLPRERWEHYADIFHGTVAYPPASPEFTRAIGLSAEVLGDLLDLTRRCRRDPGDDLVSQIVLLEVEGRRLSDEEVVDVLWNLVGGGLDTTTSATSLGMYHLDKDPSLRHRLLAQPELLDAYCEEALRWTSVNETLSRTCTADTELGGQLIKRGDFLVMSWLGANFDPEVFEDPNEFRLDRRENQHLAFGAGPHRCIGLHLARALIKEMTAEVLRRIPDFAVERERTTFYQGNPELFGVVEMPVTFTPGSRTGAERPY